MNKKIFAALASATMALSATGSLAVFAEDFDVVTEANGTNGTVSGVEKPTTDKVKVDEENFPDKEFRNELIEWIQANVKDADDFGYGDSVAVKELEKITWIHVPANVKTLSGVEYFTKLVGIDNMVGAHVFDTETAPDYTLSYAPGKLETADLSANEKLTTINFQQESNLETLLVPAGNTLTMVAVTGVDQPYTTAPIINLDLSKNKLLKTVIVANTDITTLDLSNNPYLTEVSVPSNKINSLDLTNNNALVSVNARDNELYSLDVPNTSTLITLDLGDNILQEVDLTGLTNLQNLKLDNNELKNLDLSPVASTLKTFAVGNNHIGALDLSKTNLDSYAYLNPQYVYLDSTFDGVNLAESFDDFDDDLVQADEDNYDKKKGTISFDEDSCVYSYQVKGVKDTTTLMAVTILKETVMNRLYNPNSGEHFYTSDIEEKNTLVDLGWKDEGIGWTAPNKNLSNVNAPVYRLYNPNAGDHHYTKSTSERDILVSVGWKYEGIGWYSYDTKPEQFIKTDKWPETPLKNVFPAILLFTKQVSVNCSSFLYNVIRTNNQERILSNDTHPEQQYGRFYSGMQHFI